MSIPAFLGQMKTDEAVVIGHSRKAIRLEMDGACSISGGCSHGCSSCGGKDESRATRFMVRVASPEGFARGQRVRVRRFVANEAIAAGIVFGLPLLLALTAVTIWYVLAPEQAESPAAVLSGVGGLVGGFVVAAIADRIAQHLAPTRVEPHEGGDVGQAGR
jgi:hypothetical protein